MCQTFVFCVAEGATLCHIDARVNWGWPIMLRDFQVDIKNRVYSAWQNPNVRNIMVVSPTGSGKTVIQANIVQELMWPTVKIAHRQELVGQLALALNREKIPHGLVAPTDVIRQVVALEMDMHGHSFYNARSDIRVASVNTLEKRGKHENLKPELRQWLQRVRLAIVDEGHHVLQKNIWGRTLDLLPQARGLLFTAHAVRADGAGLGRSADGVVDQLVQGPACRELINRGFLTDYRLACPPETVDVSDVPISPETGDYSQPKLRAKMHRSPTITGDVVSHYLRLAPGKLGITFAVDVEEAGKYAAAFRAAGVPAEVITAETPIHIRGQIMRKFRRRELLMLVNVDVLGEGVDVPAVEVVILARHTASWQLFCQQIGRALRLMISDELNAAWDTFTDAQRLAYIAASAKPIALIIDHVGNVMRHYAHRGLPDSPQTYSLERRERASRKGPPDAIPLRTCLAVECLHPYERVLACCPRCGTPAPAPAGRSTPEMVDGDLIELDPAALAALRGEIARIDGPVRIPESAPANATPAIYRRHHDRQAAQIALRARIALWAGYHAHNGAADAEIYKRFYFQFGTDMATAQTLGATEAQTLDERIATWLQSMNVVEKTSA